MCDCRDPNVVENYRCRTCACALCFKCATVAAQAPYDGKCPGCWGAPRGTVCILCKTCYSVN